MNRYDEQEGLDHLKAWWRRWGNYLIGLLIVVLATVVGSKNWHNWQRRQITQAEKLYEQFQQTVHSEQLDTSDPPNQPNDEARIMRIAQDMENRFGHTPYAQMTALAAAKALYRMSDITDAKTQLQWVIDHAAEVEYRQIARLRLASVLLDEKAYDEALKLLSNVLTSSTNVSTNSANVDAFKGLYANYCGDLLAAQNKLDDAQRAYQNALQWLNNDDLPMRQMVRAKLETISKR